MAVAETPVAIAFSRRLHVSTWLVAGICLALLLLANLSGYVCWEWEREETGKPYAWHHGWPWTVVQRDGAPDPVFGSPSFDRELWALHRRVLDVDPLALVGNVVVGLTLTLAIAGGFEWRRRRRSGPLQLTIGDLAGLTFIVAAVLGYGTWRYRHWERQADALDKLTYFYEVNQGTPAWFRAALPEGTFRQFDRVALIGIEAGGDLDLAPAEAFADVLAAVVSFDEWHGDPQPLRRLRSLEHLDLANECDDSVLEQFAGCHRLRSLYLSKESQVSSAGLKHLEGLAALESLSIVGLEVPSTINARSGDDFRVIAGLKRLRELEISDSVVPDGAFEYIGELPALVVLDLMDTAVSDDGIAHLRNLQSLEVLTLQHTHITDVGLATIGQLENLSELHLDDTQVGDKGLRQIAGLTKLYELTLNGTRVTGAGLVHLEGMPELRFLELQRTNAGEAAVERLRAKLPNAVVTYTPKEAP